MAIAVNDANIFIDLFDIDLIDAFFKLKLDLHTTNLVMNELEFELKTALEKQVNKKKLIVKKLNEVELEALKAKGVNFVVCENTMKQRKIEKSKFIQSATYIPAGIIEIVEKQEQGWSYVKGGY